MDQITEFMGTHFAEADYKVLFGNLLIVIGVCTILFFAFFETEPDIEVNSFVEVEKSAPTASPKRPASAKKEPAPKSASKAASRSTTPAKSRATTPSKSRATTPSKSRSTTPSKSAEKPVVKKSTAKKAKKASEDAGTPGRKSSRLSTRTPRSFD